MHVKKTILICATIIFAFSHFAFSTTIVILDQHGKPLVDAVLEIPVHQAENKYSDTPLIMDQVDKAFEPIVLIANKNSLVSFPNSDDIRHHVYSFSAAKTFELKLYASRPKAPIKFEKSGVVVLGCNIHDSMVGYIYIHDNTFAVKANNEGKVEIADAHASASYFYLWHPDAVQGVDHREKLPISILTSNKSEVTITVNTKTPAPRNTFGELSKHAH